MKRTAHASGRVHRVPSLHLVASARPLTVRTSAKRVAAAPLNTPTTVAAASLSSTSPSRQLASAGAAAVASLCLLASPAQAAQLNTLADVMRDTFSFVDSNADGVVSMNELQQISSQVSEEEGFAEPSSKQLSFTLRLFDLNQDGTLTTDEMLTSLAMDSVVSEEAVDADAVKVFDRNGDGQVERADWSKPFGDLGDRGEAVKSFVFDRVDFLYDNNGKLNVTELGNALTLVRTLTLGY